MMDLIFEMRAAEGLRKIASLHGTIGRSWGKGRRVTVMWHMDTCEFSVLLESGRRKLTLRVSESYLEGFKELSVRDWLAVVFEHADQLGTESPAMPKRARIEDLDLPDAAGVDGRVIDALLEVQEGRAGPLVNALEEATRI